MRNLVIALGLMALSCSRAPTPDNVKAAEPNPPVALPAQHTLNLTTKGSSLAVKIGGDALSFCDQGAGHTIDLNTGAEFTSAEGCGTDEGANPSCSGLDLDVTVRAPPSQPDDIIDVGASSFPVAGHVQDCAREGPELAVISSGGIQVIDTANGTTKSIDHIGGDRVALGRTWIAWTDGTKLHAQRLTP